MKIIAIQECSAGNETVGDMWLETRSFDSATPVAEIVEWGKGFPGTGKLLITVDRAPEPKP